MLSRVRQCNWCKANVRGYDHHCPAFGTCIGQKNHRLFMALLTGFVVAESTYTMCSTKYITRCINSGTLRSENPVSLNIVISTMLFSILQVVWQIVFLMWHIYCICFNIKTDEWINWKKYPEFQMREQPQSDFEVKFVNPYDKGMLCNIREFLKPKWYEANFENLTWWNWTMGNQMCVTTERTTPRILEACYPSCSGSIYWDSLTHCCEHHLDSAVLI